LKVLRHEEQPSPEAASEEFFPAVEPEAAQNSVAAREAGAERMKGGPEGPPLRRMGPTEGGPHEGLRLQNRNLAGEECAELRRGEMQAGVERPELGELGARLVEPHLVNQLLERDRIRRVEIDAPFPVVVADRARDDLGDLAGV